MFIELSSTEKRLAKFVAKQRQIKGAAVGDTAVFGGRTHEEMELDAVGAEIAFCKAFNIYADLDNATIKKEDATMKNGLTVDVKNTRYPRGKLMVVAKKANKENKQCDLYALMIGEFPRYRFTGFATMEQLFKDENIEEKYDSPAYALEQESLTKDPPKNNKAYPLRLFGDQW